MNFNPGLDDSTASVKGIVSAFLVSSVCSACPEPVEGCPLVSHIPVVSDEQVVKKN